MIVAAATSCALAAALVATGAGTARRLADRQVRAARDLLAEARASSRPVTDGPGRRPAVEDELLALTNADRAGAGAAAVGRDPCMDAAASSWARRMAETGRMAHDSGGAAAVRSCRGSGATWGENAGQWQPCSAPEMQGWWMRSPSHRPYVLDGGFRAVGVGVWADPDGRCWFQVLFGS